MELTKGLKVAMFSIMNDRITALAWGITNINVSYNQIKFDVDGFCYKGSIAICMPDDFNCVIEFSNKVIVCSVNELVEVLDFEIERKENYIENLSKLINI